MASSPELWQADLLAPGRLLTFARDRDIKIFNLETIEHLWQVGLLRADLVTSKRLIKVPLLDHIGRNDEGRNIYLDARNPKRRPKGYGGSFPKRRPRKDIDLYFHRFRFYIFYHINRVFSFKGSSTQYLLYPEDYERATKHWLQTLDRWSSDQKFCEMFDKWNLTAEAAIVFDPVAYNKVFGHVRWRLPDTRQTILDKRQKYRQTIELTFDELDVERFERFQNGSDYKCRNAG